MTTTPVSTERPWLRAGLPCSSIPYVEAAAALLDRHAGASATARVRVTPAQLGYYDRSMTYRVDPGDAEVSVGPDVGRGQVARIR